METYIVRIHRCQKEDKSPASVGIVEDAESGRKTRFAGSSELLKILKLEKRRTCGNKNLKQKKGDKG